MNDNLRSNTKLGVGAFIIAILAALVGLRLGGDTTKPSFKENQDAAKAGQLRQVSDEGTNPHEVRLWQLLPAGQGGKANQNSSWECAFHDRLKKNADRLTCLIVSIPDPLSTPQGHWFDGVIDSIVRAASTIGYTPVGNYLPWAGHAPKASSCSCDGHASKGDELPFQKYPGILVFRGVRNYDNGTAKVEAHTLAVLLVGTTPNGVRAEPLTKALEMAAKIGSAGKNPATTGKPTTIRMIAPHYSGASLPMCEVIRQWDMKREARGDREVVEIAVISGSADALDKRVWEAGILDWGNSAGEIAPENKLVVKIQSTVIPYRVLQNAALTFLRDRTVNPEALVEEDHEDAPGQNKENLYDDVALLVEANTGFGSGQWSKGEKKRWPKYFPFPLHLSRVQARYTALRLEREGRMTPDVWNFADLSVNPFSAESDIPSVLDQKITPRLIDRAVDDITAAIRRNRFRCVGLLATDPQDVVFLVERIRRDCQDVEIFVTGMDLTYALPENRHVMRGVVISSTYPLYPPNQGWVNPESGKYPPRQTFKGEGEQGCYNAAIIHLAEAATLVARDNEGKKLGQDERHARKSDLLQEYWPPVYDPLFKNDKKPPVWIMSIGENGRYVPHGYYRYKLAENSPLLVEVSPPDRGQGITRPALNLVLVVIAVVLLGGVVVLGWLIWGRPPDGAPTFPSLRELLCPGGLPLFTRWCWAALDDGGQRVGWCQSLAASALIVAVAPILLVVQILLWPLFLGEEQNGWIPPALWLAWLAAGGIVALALLLQGRLLVRYVASNQRGWQWAARLVTNALLILPGFGFVAYLLCWWVWAEVPAQVLFAERAVNLATGYSVLIPVVTLCLGFLMIAWFGLRQHYLSHCFCIQSPCPSLSGEGIDPALARQWAGLQRAVAELQAEFGTTDKSCPELAQTRVRHARWRWLIVAGVAYMFGALALVIRYRWNSEGLAWNLVFLFGFIGLSGAAVANAVRLVSGWRRLGAVLKRLALLPLAGAFDRLPRIMADLFGGYLLTRTPRSYHPALLTHLLGEVRQLRARADSTRPEAPSDQAIAGPASVSAESLPPAVEEKYPGAEFDPLARQAQSFVGDLARTWPERSVTQAYGAGQPGSDDGNTPADAGDGRHAWEEKAEEFVAVQAIVFVSQFFIRLRLYAGSAVCTSVALFLAATVYPFQPEQLILYLQATLLVAVGGAVVWVLIGLSRNEVIRRITRATSNRLTLNWGLAVTLIQYSAPIAVLLLIRLSGRMRALVEPFLDAIR